MHFTNFHDRASTWLFASAAVLNIAQWVTVATWPPVALAPLHYTIYFGIDLSGASWQLYALPAVGAVIILVHAVISVIQPSTLWRRLWSLSALASCLLLTGAMMTLRVTTFR